ncbi:MAG: hypothetical protein Q8N65_03025 [bacterium]|nr:hypothetical protein [bacterium]
MMWGHRKQWQFLRKSVQLGKTSHAYLFSGKRLLGKKEIAQEFARLLNCRSEDFDKKPCRQCSSCREMEKSCHPDFLLIENTDKIEETEINLIRHLGDWLSLKPGLGKFKVAIIDQFQTFSLAAQSALLKTLEEPRGQTVLILVSDYPELLVPTIISRLQEIKFHPLSSQEIINLLLAAGADESLADRISHLSSGKPLKARRLLNPDDLKKEEERIKKFAGMLSQDLVFWFHEIEVLTKESDVLPENLEVWLDFTRLLFLVKMGIVKKENLNQNQQKLFGKTESIPASKLKSLLFSLDKTNYLLSRSNVNPRLAIENSILGLF